MKAINDYRILMPNIPFYQTGVTFNEFDVVYYTGINPGTYIDDKGNSRVVAAPFTTGYFYCKTDLPSGENFFYNRPDGNNSGYYWTNQFFFVPTYGSTVSFKANYYENKFQDDYTVIIGKSENVVQVDAKLQFNNITDNEAKALNHFYQASFVKPSQSDGQGLLPVQMALFPPHSKVRPFYLKTIDNNFEMADLNSVSLTLESPFVSITQWKEKLIPYGNSDYDKNVEYSKNDYVFLNNQSSSAGFYYYTGDESTKGANPIESNAVWTQKFYFQPDNAQQLSFNSNSYKNDLGNFYLYQNDGINPNFFDFSLTFNNRSDKEAKAILHFLENHNGIDLFDYDMHTFFTGTRSFYCPEWSHTYNFLDNNSISARFIESKFNFDRNFDFITVLIPTGFNFGFLPKGFQINKEYGIVNSGKRYPVSYTILDNVPSNSSDIDRFLHDPKEDATINVMAGSTGYFNIIYQLPTNKTASSQIEGYFNVDQSQDNFGIVGSLFKIYYTGSSAADGSSAPYDFLSGVQNCVASPVLYEDEVAMLVRWTLPQSGYFFTGFSGRISTNSGFSPSSVVTGKSISIPLNTSNYLYDIGTPGITTYEMLFTDLDFNTDYYVTISGVNNTYTDVTGQAVFASGVAEINSWPSSDPVSGYEAVFTGLTTGILNQIGSLPPNLKLTKKIESRTITSQNFDYFDVYDYIKNNCTFADKFNLYSGIVLNLNNVFIGPNDVFDNYDIYSTGTCIITGNYSFMPSGLTMNLYNNSAIYGKGGSTSKLSTESDAVKTGKNALYVNCSGKLNLNLDNSSFIVAGAGAGDNITLRDVVNFSNNKFATLKDTFKREELSSLQIFDPFTKTSYTKSKIDKMYTSFNASNNITINADKASTLGSSIFYDFFDPTIIPSGLVYGSPGGSFGTGYFTANLEYVKNSELNKSSNPYVLSNIFAVQGSLYPLKSS